ncbi:MAG: MFS transporter [archaeon]|nr:MFS transporter [archaeon]
MSETLTYETMGKRQRDFIMLGLAVALFAACFDGTVTSTCGPIIAAQFAATDLLPWLTTGYLLMETVTIPLSGKLSDLYGRKKLLIVGLILFGIASLVAGFATNMWLMIIARALQGAGGGILIPVATAAVSDLYPPEERGKIQGALGALFGIGMGLGPLIGGSFASLGDLGFMHGWQFAFLINIPVVLFVIFVCRHEFPSVAADRNPVIDFRGSLLLSGALILLVFYFQMVGKQFDIVSIPSLIYLFVILMVLRLFSHVESKVDEPLIAPHIFENPSVKYASILLFLLGFAMVGDELFMGMYLQKITGHTAVEAGMFILIMVAGMIISSTAGGALLNRTGTKPWIVVGPILMCAGFFMFSLITTEFDAVIFSVSEFLFGLGAGCLLASLMVAVQNSCDHSEVGMTTSAVTLMRNIGSTTGTSVLTLIVNAAIYQEAIENPPLDNLADAGIGILDHLGEFGGAMDGLIKSVFTDGVATAFGFAAIALLFATYLGFKFKVVKVSQTAEIKAFEKELTKDNSNH